DSGSLAQLAQVGMVGSFQAPSLNLSVSNNSVLAALNRIESAIHAEGAAPTGAAVSTRVDSNLANVITQHARPADPNPTP
ncbi:MAG TPA: hypothetical protein VI138_00610, partial [Candidatus Dormibacteraeota bacterium]